MIVNSEIYITLDWGGGLNQWYNTAVMHGHEY
jgi:hypothetical protein